MGGAISVTLLGRFEVAVDGEPVPDDVWRRRQAAALVKLLALAPGGARHREQVLDTLWPDLAPDEAAPRLHKAAHFARRAIGPGTVVMAGDLVSLAGGAPLEVDVDRFVAEAEAALAGGGAPEAKRALAHWTGPLLPADVYEPWTEVCRDRVERLHRLLLRAAGRWDELLAVDPTDEEAHLAVMRTMAAAGDRRGALRQYERLDRVLSRELGVGPSPAAVALRDELVAADLAEFPAPAVTPTADPELPPALLAQIDAASAGRGCGAFVRGPSSAATALVLDAVVRTASAAGWRVGRGQAALIEGAWPYAPVLEALADLCRAHPALLDGLDDTLRAELEGALSGGTGDWRGDAAHRRLFVAAAELVRMAAGGVGTVLAVDGIDEADEASLRLLHHLVRASSQLRVLVVLGDGGSGAGPALDSVRASLLERGAAVEVVLDLPGGIAEPTEAEAAALVAALPGALRDHLERVALTGAGFDTDLFVALSDLAERGAFDQLDVALAERAVVVDQAGYRFAPRVRDALVERLAPHRLRTSHRLVAERLIAMGASPARIAHHLLAAGDPGAAVPHALRAARAEAAVGAYRDALALLEPIRPVATGADAAAAAALRAELLAAVGDPAAVQAYREAIEAGTADDRGLVAGLARAAIMAGDLATASAALDNVEPGDGADEVSILLAKANLAFHTGDIATASAAADRARGLLVSGDASWQLLDLVTLQGLLAHLRGEWFERLRLELRRTAEEPDLARAVFDSHLCVAEYLLYGPTPYDEVIDLATALQRTAARSGAARAEAFAAALAGEAALLAGRLDEADGHLQEAIDLHREVGASAGEAHSLQRLAEVHLARGDRDGASPLLLRAMRLARWSTLSQHLVQRIYGTMILAAPDPTSARALVDRAAAETGNDDACSFCHVMLAVPATIACAASGDLDAAHRHLAAAERSARLWDGTAWQAAVEEARALVAAAEGDRAAAAGGLGAAARTFADAGQPLDAERCRQAATAFT